MSRLLRAALTAALLAVLVVAAPAAAQAGDGTVLYIHGGNVWMATPDGSQRHQVTGDGGWSAPSMADDGTIVAIKDRAIVRLDAAGTVLSSFVPNAFASGPQEAQVDPSGELVLFWSVEVCTDPNGQLRGCFWTQIVYADGRQVEPLGDVVLDYNGTWLPNGDVAVGSYGVETFGIGDSETTPWFRFDNDFEPGTIAGPDDIGSLSVDRAGEWLVANGYVFDNGQAEDGSDSRGVEGLLFYELNGPPPAQPEQVSCIVEEPEDGPSFDLVRFAPAGDGFVVSITDDPTDASEATTDVMVVRDFDPATCDAQLELLQAGAVDPFWSAAPYNPSGGPITPPPGGGSTPPAPDEPLIELPDASRLDGGSQADPVGQTVATSQAVWRDGEAELVVLATAERFPDALAGAALAGERGPILVTPFADQLDSRVAAEIARVTGGNGMVLVLGGTAAVTEGAAAQAFAAAGTSTCPQPFPADCRYAGVGREDTAARIGETVLALNGGSGGRVLLARGDAFADAITGGAYAAEGGIPILLTPSNQLNEHTSAFLTRHGVAEVIVLGGTAAIDQPTVDALPVATSRRVAGDDRTATAAAIATELWHAEGLDGGGVVLVNVRADNGWQTALSAAVVSALANAPQLGVENPPAAPTPATLQAAATVGGPVFAFGGADLVSDQQALAVVDAG